MENLRMFWESIKLLGHFWPFIVIPLLFGLVGLFVREGFTGAIQILKRLGIGIAILVAIFIIIMLFI